MRIALLGVSLALLHSLVGCDDRAPPDDPFFDAPEETWVQNARSLSVGEVYRLYKLLLEEPLPPDTRLAEALGPHGRQAVELWVRDLESTGAVRYAWEFGPILGEARRRGGFSLCEDDPSLYSRAIRALNSRWGFRDASSARRMISPYCGLDERG